MFRVVRVTKWQFLILANFYGLRDNIGGMHKRFYDAISDLSTNQLVGPAKRGDRAEQSGLLEQ